MIPSLSTIPRLPPQAGSDGFPLFGSQKADPKTPQKSVPRVAYPLLRVEIEKIEVERVGGLPPSLLRPTSIEPLDLYIDGHLSSLWTAKAADLAKLTPQLAINALQQRGGAGDFTCYSL